MNPTEMFCDQPDCPLRGQRGQGNILIHSGQGARYRCATCGHTFSATQGTPFYRLRTPAAQVAQVLTLLGHG